MSLASVSKIIHKLPNYSERIAKLEGELLPANIFTLLEEAAAEVPDEIAWDFFEEGEKISYKELVSLVNRLSNGLLAIGVKFGTRVGVMLPNIGAMPTTWLALARIGAVMVPINTRYTLREVQYALDNSDAKYIVIDDKLLGEFDKTESVANAFSQKIIVVGGQSSTHLIWQKLIDDSTTEVVDRPLAPQLDDVVNIQFTSGTTGLPKGCILTHRYWLTLAKVQSQSDGLPYKRFLAPNPFFYMTPQWLLLAAFYQRGTLYVAARKSARKFMGWVSTYKINYCLFDEIIYRQPPSPFDGAHELMKIWAFSHNKENHRDLEERFQVKARDGFGMTELGVALMMPIERDEMVGAGSVGVPTAFRECRVADPDGNELPAGEIGELQVRGPGIFTGYYENEEATQAAFSGSWFRTGDLVRRDEQGYFYFVGRFKDMIRRSGENIAALEVEQVVNDILGIEESAAVAVPDSDRGEEVKLFVVLKPGMTKERLSPSAIVAACAGELAVFKRPRYIEYHPMPLPRSATGTKIIKSQLPKDISGPGRVCWDMKEERWL